MDRMTLARELAGRMKTADDDGWMNDLTAATLAEGMAGDDLPDMVLACLSGMEPGPKELASLTPDTLKVRVRDMLGDPRWRPDPKVFDRVDADMEALVGSGLDPAQSLGWRALCGWLAGDRDRAAICRDAAVETGGVSSAAIVVGFALDHDLNPAYLANGQPSA